jgi:hypothetical protein
MQNDNPSTDNNNDPRNNTTAFPGDMLPQIEEQLSSWMLSLRSERRSEASLLAEKLDSEHISTIIANGAKEDERSFSAFKIERFIGIAIFVISLIFALTLLIVFRDSEHFITIVTALFSFLGGLGVGKFIMPGKGER